MEKTFFSSRRRWPAGELYKRCTAPGGGHLLGEKRPQLSCNQLEGLGRLSIDGDQQLTLLFEEVVHPRAYDGLADQLVIPGIPLSRIWGRQVDLASVKTITRLGGDQEVDDRLIRLPLGVHQVDPRDPQDSPRPFMSH